MATHSHVMTTDKHRPSPESDARRVPERQAGRGLCTAPFVPGLWLSEAVSSFAAALTL
jgi:hypothetical protein